MRPVLFALAALTATAAQAADHSNLETNFPLVVEDAYTVGRNGIETQLFARGRRLHDDPAGDGLSELTARIEWGAFSNFQLSVEAPYFFGSGEAADSGEIGVDSRALQLQYRDAETPGPVRRPRVRQALRAGWR